MGDGTDVPPIGLLSNIPESPMAQSHLATAEILEADGYDSDKEVNNNNPIINEESLEEEEEELPEVGENLDAAEGEETATNVGTFINIPQEAMKKMKVVELKAELTKCRKSTTGLKAVLLERLKDAIANRVVIVGNTSGATTTTPDDLRGFAKTACWKPLVPMEAVVEEPTNRVSMLHAPAVPADDASFLPQKHDFAEEFDHLPFVGKEKIPKFHRNGHPVMKDGKQVFTEQFNSKGGPKAEFIQDNKLGVDSTPQDWFNAFLPLYDGTSRFPEREKAGCFSHKWASFTNKKAVQMGAGVQGGCYPTFVPFSYKEIERFLGLYMLQGLNPSPQVEMKFFNQRSDPVQGSDLCHRIFGDNANKWHKQFKAFFCLQDPAKQAPARKDQPTYKVDSFLKHLQMVSMSAWRLGGISWETSKRLVFRDVIPTS